MNENDIIALHDLDLEMDFVDYVGHLTNRTSKRTICNYIAWRFIVEASKYLNDDLRELHETKTLSVQCIQQTRKLYVKFHLNFKWNCKQN